MKWLSFAIAIAREYAEQKHGKKGEHKIEQQMKCVAISVNKDDIELASNAKEHEGIKTACMSISVCMKSRYCVDFAAKIFFSFRFVYYGLLSWCNECTETLLNRLKWHKMIEAVETTHKPTTMRAHTRTHTHSNEDYGLEHKTHESRMNEWWHGMA